MLKTTASRLAAFAAGLALAAGSAAAIGAATGATPPFQDCLKVAAANAGFGNGTMADAGHGAQPMIEAVPGSDGLHAQLAGLRLTPLSRTLTAGAVHDLEVPDHRLRREPRPPLRPRQHQAAASDRRPHGPQRLPASPPDAGLRRDVHDRAADRASRQLPRDHRLRDRRTQVRPRHHPHRPGAVRTIPSLHPALHGSIDGYDVELQRPAQLTAGQEAQLTFRITHGGQPVNDLEPYLGSYGHLVALHAPELAYSHVHPISADPANGAITFNTELSERGTYRLFLQFQTHGRVHTVALTQTIS